MVKKNSLTRVTLIYGAGDIVSKIFSFLLVFILTFYLSKEVIGEYDLIISTIFLLTPLLGLQLSDATLRWLLEDQSTENITKVYSNVFSIVLINLILFTVLYWITIQFLKVSNITIIYFLILIRTIQPLFQITARGLSLNSTYVVSGITYSFFYVLFTLIGVIFFNLGLVGILLGTFISSCFAIFYLLIKMKHYRYFSLNKIDLNFAKDLLRYSLPLLPNSLSWWAITSANRFLILYFLGVSANGLFAISYKIPTIILMLTNFFYMAWQEKAIMLFNKNGSEIYFSSVLKKYLNLLFSSAFILISLNKIIIEKIVALEFFEAWKYIPLLIIATIFQSLSSFFGVGYIVTKETKKAFSTSIFGGITTVFISLFLIPQIGLYGAALGIMLGYIVMFILRLSQTSKYLLIKFPMNHFFLLSTILILIILLSLSSINYIIIFNIIISITLFFIINKEMIILNIKKSIKSIKQI